MRFLGIFFYQVIVSGSKSDNFGSRKIAHPVMYHSSIFIDFPGSSLRTNKHTNTHTNRHVSFINIEGFASKSDAKKLAPGKNSIFGSPYFNV